MTEGKRYKAIDDSMSGHYCCFQATVIDMEYPVMIHGKHLDNQYESVCECMTRQEADRIADALNVAESKKCLAGTITQWRATVKYGDKITLNDLEMIDKLIGNHEAAHK